MNILRRMTVFAAALILAAPVSAHHSDAGMDMESTITFDGTVKEFAWRNPHVYVIVETEQSGEPVDWELQMGPIHTSTRRGWTRDSLSPGDQVRVQANPMTDGRPYGILRSLDKEGLSMSQGLPGLIAGLAAEGETPPATSLAGKWLTDLSKISRYPGGFDGFFHANLTLSDKGRAAQAAYDPLSSENPESTCVGRPTPSALVSTYIYVMEIDLSQQEEIIVFRSEWFDEVRTIHMDGRGHPDPSERFVTGHSIGWWQDDTLVVDTANFADHRSPYQIGVPSGGQKHVIEQYRLAVDGTYMDAEFILEDPEYLARPMLHYRLLIPAPHLEMTYGECDEVNAGRWLRE